MQSSGYYWKARAFKSQCSLGARTLINAEGEVINRPQLLAYIEMRDEDWVRHFEPESRRQLLDVTQHRKKKISKVLPSAGRIVAAVPVNLLEGNSKL